MTMVELLNVLASGVIFAGVTWACFSPSVCDGILIKKGLIALALGAAANMVNPSGHAKLWILCSLALIVVFIGVRIVQARMKHRSPVFIKRQNMHERRSDRASRAA